MNQRKSSVVHTLDAAAGVTTLHTFLGNNAAVFINSTTATVPEYGLGGSEPFVRLCNDAVCVAV